MTVTQFLEGRSVDRQALTRYINRHQQEYEGHVSRVGRDLELDEVAVELLDRQYPRRIVEVQVDEESRAQVILLQQQIIKQQEERQTLERQLHQAALQIQQTTLALEQRDEAAALSQALLQERELRIQERDLQIEDLKARVEALENRHWWQLLRPFR